MSDESEIIVHQALPAPVPLNRPLRRVLGVLIEKAFCTPEYYPLSANAVVTGCNQKSNRNPVTDYAPHIIDESLMTLQDAGLVIRVFPAGGRVERWKHHVKEAWQLDRPHRAVLAELILRGPQTEGELRTRASRMANIESLEQLGDVLSSLADRSFVRRLSPEQQKRGVIWTHLLYPPDELARVEARISEHSAESSSTKGESDASTSVTRPVPASGTPDLRDRVAYLENQLLDTQAVIEQLRQELESVRGSVEKLATGVQTP